MSKRIKKRWQSAEMNNAYYRMYYELLVQMSCASYQWENLPTEIDERFLQMTLIERGLSVFFYDDEYDAFFATMGAPNGKINMYNNPLGYIAYGSNGFRRTLKSTECIPIWANFMRRPNINMLEIYARRLADIDRTIDVNILAQKTPIILRVPEQLRLTVENLVKQYTGNEPVIIGDDSTLTGIEMQYLAPDAPFITLDLLKAKTAIWSEIMTYLGIDNTPISKAERVQSAEVYSNNDQITVCRLIQLDTVRAACKEINRKYDLDVWYNYANDMSSKNQMLLDAANPELALNAGSES